MMKIGILQADSVLDEYQPAHGNYPDMFMRVLGAAASESLDYAIYNVEAGEYPADIDECDGYIITGSRKSVYEQDDWILTLKEYVKTLNDARKKTVGICFGHQMMALALGGETRSADAGWGVGVQDFKIIDQQSFMDPPCQEICLLCSHKDQVTRLPEDAKLLASSDYCPIGAFSVGDHFLAIQGHPEFLKPYAKNLMEMRREILGEDKFAEGIRSLESDTSELTVARWMLNFLTVEKESAGSVPRGFKGARKRAEEMLTNVPKLQNLLQAAIEKTKSERSALADVWQELLTMIRLLRSWVKRDYTGASTQTMLLIVTAVLYFVTPIDVIPDFLLALGFVDDAAIIVYVLGLVRSELEKFKDWEAQSSTNIIAPEDNPFRQD